MLFMCHQRKSQSGGTDIDHIQRAEDRYLVINHVPILGNSNKRNIKENWSRVPNRTVRKGFVPVGMDRIIIKCYVYVYQRVVYDVLSSARHQFLPQKLVIFLVILSCVCYSTCKRACCTDNVGPAKKFTLYRLTQINQ